MYTAQNPANTQLSTYPLPQKHPDALFEPSATRAGDVTKPRCAVCVVKRKRGELPPGVTRDDIRKCANRIKEKLLDKCVPRQKSNSHAPHPLR